MILNVIVKKGILKLKIKKHVLNVQLAALSVSTILNALNAKVDFFWIVQLIYVKNVSILVPNA